MPGRDDSAETQSGGHPRDIVGLVQECLDRLERGEELGEVLDSLTRDRPEQREELEARVRMLAEAGLLEPPSRSPSEDLPERLGDFDLVRRIGSGGMGVVYLARQRALGREVALKLLRSEQLFHDGARARFQREVDASARLAHPNVVQIVNVGEEGSIPFIAMEYVRGCSLDRVLTSLQQAVPSELRGEDMRRAVEATLGPAERASGEWNERFWRGTWTELCLRIARAIADALEHAHGRGVLHRDVKPSNVMVTPDGRVVLLDFGLASLQGADRVTRTGAVLGSLPYMAPEQLEGRSDQIDLRTDVYGLGVTLYELLTLRSPYLDVSSSERTRARILEGRPERPRRIDPTLPIDAQTVCLTAMDRDPERRYPSARALADDVTCTLDRRPIAARPAGLMVHVRRWAQRRPGSAVAAALVFLIVTLGPTGFAIQQNRARLRVKAQFDRAERNFQRSLAAIELLSRVAKRDLADVPQASRARGEMLEEALRFYRHMALEPGEDPTLRYEVARASRRVGEIEYVLGDLEASEQAYREAVASLIELPDDPALERREVELAESWRGLWCILYTTGRDEEAAEANRSALAALGRSGATVDGLELRLELRLDIARAHSQSARLLTDTGDTHAAEEDLARAIEVLAPLLDELEASPGATFFGLSEEKEIRGLHADALSRMGLVHAARRESNEAVSYFEEAVEEFERVHELDPQDPVWREQVLIVRSNLAASLLELNDIAPSLPHLERAAEVGASLVADFPDVDKFVGSVSGVMINQSIALMKLDRFEESLAVCERAGEHLRRLLAKQPGNFAYRDRLLGVLVVQIELSYQTDEYDRALMFADEAEVEIERLLAVRPSHPQVLAHRRDCAGQQMRLAVTLGDHVRAVELARVCPPGDPSLFAYAASWAVASVELARGDPGLTLAERAELEAEYGDLAKELLRRAVVQGARDPELAGSDRFEPLSDDPELQDLLIALAGEG